MSTKNQSSRHKAEKAKVTHIYDCEMNEEFKNLLLYRVEELRQPTADLDFVIRHYTQLFFSLPAEKQSVETQEFMERLACLYTVKGNYSDLENICV